MKEHRKLGSNHCNYRILAQIIVDLWKYNEKGDKVEIRWGEN